MKLSSGGAKGVLMPRAGYEAVARRYDEGNWVTRVVGPVSRRVVREEIRRRCVQEGGGKMRVLDLGCGTGSTSAWLGRLGARVVCVDQSPAMLAIARSRARHGTTLIEADIRSLKILGGLFDVVLASLVLDHVPRLEPVFRGAAARMAKRGVFIAVDLHPYFALFNHRCAEFQVDGDKYNVKTWQHRFVEYLDAAKAAGLRVARVAEIEMSGSRLTAVTGAEDLGLRLSGRVPVVLVIWLVRYGRLETGAALNRKEQGGPGGAGCRDARRRRRVG